MDNIYDGGLNKYIRNTNEFNPHTLISTIINKHNIPYVRLKDDNFYVKNFNE